MSIEMLERAATVLGPIVDEVVFVRGATIELSITDPGAPAPRTTLDVDAVVEITTRCRKSVAGTRVPAPENRRFDRRLRRMTDEPSG